MDQCRWETALIDELKFTPVFIATSFLVERKRRKSQLSFFRANRGEA